VEGKGPKGEFFTRGRGYAKTCILRNEPELPPWYFERIYRNASELEHGSTFLHSGSFFENEPTAEAF